MNIDEVKAFNILIHFESINVKFIPDFKWISIDSMDGCSSGVGQILNDTLLHFIN